MSYIAAYFLLTLLLIIISPKHTIAYRYSIRVWISLDQFVNTATFGSEDHTISGRAGRGRNQGSRFWTLVATVIDWLFRDKNHCADAIEHDRPGPDYQHAAHMLVIYGASGAFSVWILGQLLTQLF